MGFWSQRPQTGEGDVPPCFDYRLPVSVLRISGEHTVERRGSEVEASRRVAGVAVSVQADERKEAAGQLVLPRVGDTKYQLQMRALPDGRVVSLGGDVDVTHGAWLSAALGVGSSVGAATAGLHAFGPAGSAVSLAAMLAAGVVAAAYTSYPGRSLDEQSHGEERGILGGQPGVFDDEEAMTDDGTERADPWTALGIAADYGREHPAEAQFLASYRTAVDKLRLAHAAAAAATAADPSVSARLQDLSTALDDVEQRAQAPEERYRAWLATQVTTTTLHRDECFYVEDLPEDTGEPPDVTALRTNYPRLVDVAEVLGVLVTRQYLGSLEPQRTGEETTAASDPGALRYRVPRSAALRIWRRNQDGFVLERVERVGVVVSGAERTLDVLGSGDSALNVTFDDAGALVDVSASAADRQAERAAALAALPAAVKDAADAGAAVRSSVAGSASATAASEPNAGDGAGATEARMLRAITQQVTVAPVVSVALIRIDG